RDRRGDGGGAVDGDGEDEAVVVVCVLADEVDAAGRCGSCGGGGAEGAGEGVGGGLEEMFDGGRHAGVYVGGVGVAPQGGGAWFPVEVGLGWWFLALADVRLGGRWLRLVVRGGSGGRG